MRDAIFWHKIAHIFLEKTESNLGTFSLFFQAYPDCIPPTAGRSEKKKGDSNQSATRKKERKKESGGRFNLEILYGN